MRKIIILVMVLHGAMTGIPKLLNGNSLKRRTYPSFTDDSTGKLNKQLMQESDREKWIAG